jgi:hypothetical protein
MALEERYKETAKARKGENAKTTSFSVFLFPFPPFPFLAPAFVPLTIRPHRDIQRNRDDRGRNPVAGGRIDEPIRVDAKA